MINKNKQDVLKYKYLCNAKTRLLETWGKVKSINYHINF